MDKLSILRRELRSAGIELPEGPIAVGSLGDSPELSAELLALVREGRKRATASLLWSWEHEGEPLPRARDHEILVDAVGAPAIVIRLTSVDVVAFDRVGAGFAAREGEGDGSLAHWRHAHEAFFARECERIGRAPAADMPVVCVEFEVEHVVPATGERG